MENINSERIRHSRYDTELKVFFHKQYNIKTRVVFKAIASVFKGILAHEQIGLSKNISAEGLCFVSHYKLGVGDLLMLRVYPPNVKTPIKVRGKVCWSKEIPGDNNRKSTFLTGVKLLTVNGKSVPDSIHFDEKYKVIWSAVLDALFHNFSGIAMVNEFKKNKLNQASLK